MEAIKDSIVIKASASAIYDTVIKIFLNENNYKAWHINHVTCKWIKGKPFEKGSILYAEEKLHGALHKMKFIVSSIETNKHLEMKVLFPVSIICPKGGFYMEQINGSAMFTAVLYFRFAKLFRKYASDRVQEIMIHMKEEGEGIKRIIENGLFG